MKSLWIIAVSAMGLCTSAFASNSPLSMDKATTWKVLNKEYKVSFVDTPLVEAASWMEDALRADCNKCTQVLLDEKFFQDHRIATDTIVNFKNERALPAVTILETILRDIDSGLGFRVDDEGKINIAAANPERVTRAEAMTWMQLQTKTDVEFRDNELRDVIDYLQEFSLYQNPKGLPLEFYVERKVYSRGEWSQHVTLSLKKVSIYYILNKILTDRKLSFKIDPLSGLIYIQG